MQVFPMLTKQMDVVTENAQQPGRWVLAPRKGSRFVGPRERARRRARDRRRKIVVVLLEALVVTGLIGLFPPLRGMLWLTGILVFLLAAYLGLVVYMVGTGERSSVVTIPDVADAPRIRILTPSEHIDSPGEPPRVRVAAR